MIEFEEYNNNKVAIRRNDISAINECCNSDMCDIVLKCGKCYTVIGQYSEVVKMINNRWFGLLGI